jgi:hypothetical protein
VAGHSLTLYTLILNMSSTSSSLTQLSGKKGDY